MKENQELLNETLKGPSPLGEDISPLNKLSEMVQGKIVIMSDEQLDLLCPFDVSNLIRSRPNPNQCGTKDRWECWIERRDLSRFPEGSV